MPVIFFPVELLLYVANDSTHLLSDFHSYSVFLCVHKHDIPLSVLMFFIDNQCCYGINLLKL